MTKTKAREIIANLNKGEKNIFVNYTHWRNSEIENAEFILHLREVHSKGVSYKQIEKLLSLGAEYGRAECAEINAGASI